MDSTQRKGINFDLDTEVLKEHYPKGDWHNAYCDVRSYFEKNGFEHIQGSGYHSTKEMSEIKAMARNLLLDDERNSVAELLCECVYDF